MPTLAEVQMLNNSLDSLANTLMRRKALRQDDAQTIRRDALTRELQQQALKARADEGDADRIERAAAARLASEQSTRQHEETMAERQFGRDQAERSRRLTEGQMQQRNQQAGKGQQFEQAATIARMIQGGMVDPKKLNVDVLKDLNAKLKPFGIEAQNIELVPLKAEQTGTVTQEIDDETGASKTSIKRPLKPGETFAPASNRAAMEDPVATQVSEIEKQIRENQSQQALGDKRTRLLNYKSRDDVIQGLLEQRKALQAVPSVATLENARTQLAPSNAPPAQITEQFDAAAIIAQAKEAIAKGAPKEQVIARLKAMGIAWTE